jgi:DNA ligase-1
LYGTATNGKIKVWKIWVEPSSTGTATILTDHGYEDGEKQRASVTVLKGKNVGRSNETTPYQQACLEATSKWNKKTDRKYVSKKADLKKVAEQMLPMLAHDFKKRGKSIDWPAYVQPKLNGVRCLAKMVNRHVIEYTSREGKLFTTLNHLSPHLLKLMRPKETLDGELFTWELTFQEICSAVKRQQDASLLLEFWVYDCVQDTTFDDRTKYLSKLLSKKSPIVEVPTRLVKGTAQMLKLHQQMVATGYEGTIIRNMVGTYHSGPSRSADLQKYKDFVDEEFEIVGGKQGVGKDEGAVTFVCVTEEEKQFDCRPRGAYAQRRKWWDNLSKLLGKKLTVRYQNRTDDNIPYLPVGIAIRDYE